jgi:alpha-methylacyl-CoA racemase
MVGTLDGVKIVELAGIGPGPFASMLLADMGADVLRIDRPEAAKRAQGGAPPRDILNRNRRSVAVDLKSDAGRDLVLQLVERADVLLEGFRPGVAERLGVGPDECAARNERLVYGRMTGWGQEGPLAHAAGHDIDYISIAGVLAHIGRRGERPVPPINLVGDFGGGGMFLAFGVVCALLERERSGKGQVVDAAMVDGAALLMSMMWGMRAGGVWQEEVGTNLLDTGAPFYDTYETADGKFVAIGSIEPQFYAELLSRAGLDAADLPAQNDRSHWEEMRGRFTELFKSKTRDEWCELLEGSDACFAPVLTMTEATSHPHIRARETLVERDGVWQPAPAPRFSRTPGALEHPPARAGEHTDEALADWGFDDAQLRALHDAGAIA